MPRVLAFEDVKGDKNRHPWQVSGHITFPSQPGALPSATVELHEVSEIKADQRLFVNSLMMAPNTMTAAPNPSNGDGQFILIVKGTLWYSNKEHKAYTLVYVEPTEGPFLLQAGAEGIEAIVTNFPRKRAGPVENIAPSMS